MNLTGKILLSTAALVAFSSSAMAADLMMPAKAAPFVAAPSTNWDGAYIGINGGYDWGNSTKTGGTGTNAFGTFALAGGTVGGTIGYNFHLSDNVVGGVEGDLDWANVTGTFNGIVETINWDGSVRARLGLDVGSGLLPYITGGVAFAGSNRAFGGVTESITSVGWTAGVGVEYMISDNLSAKIEYRYSDYGSHTYTTLPTTPIVDLTDSTVRIGLNWHF
jgi:outer membrane immunogenic protein